jgi:hypothetical protein
MGVAKLVARPIARAAQKNYLRSKDCRKHLIRNRWNLHLSAPVLILVL